MRHPRLRALLIFCAGFLLWNGGILRAAPVVISAPGCRDPSISGDGRVVAYTSTRAVVKGDTNGINDVFAFDRSTKTLTKVSDPRGGDMPLVTADGRTVFYRGLGEFPMVRSVDLVLGTPPVTESHAFGPDDMPALVSLRLVENFATSPDGRFLAFPFLPTPGLTLAPGTPLCLADRTNTDFTAATPGFLNNRNLVSTGRVAVTADGQNLYFETSDPLPSDDMSADTNGAQDIYFAQLGTGALQRISIADTNDRGSAHHPALNGDGSLLFFISDHPLHAEDPVQRAYLYLNLVGGSQTTLIRTPSVKPVALSRQASGTGSYTVFLGQAANGTYRPWIVRYSDGKLAALAAGSPAIGGEPALSADDSQVAIVDAAGRIVVVPNPLLIERAPAPMPGFLSGTDQQTVTDATTLDLKAFGDFSQNEPLQDIAIEIDGHLLAQVEGQNTNLVTLSLSLPLGSHTLRALAITVQGVPGASAPITVNVIPAAEELVLAGASQLRRTGDAGQATTFSASVRVTNNRTAQTGPLQLVVTEIPFFSTWGGFDADAVRPDPSDPNNPEEQAIQMIAIDFLPLGGTVPIAVSGTTLPAIVLAPNAFQGFGWQVHAQLQEFDGTDWVDADDLDLFQVLPVLNEQTQGPNSGLEKVSGAVPAPSFQPAVITGITIRGRASIGEFSSGTYVCEEILSSGPNRRCSPVWSIVSGGDFASVSDKGVVTGKQVAAKQAVTLRAVYDGFKANFALKIVPVPPIISVLAKDAPAKPGTSGTFRILRTPLTAGSVDVSYAVSGTALAADSMSESADYTALASPATIDVNASFTDVTVAPHETSAFTGSRSVTLTLQPDPLYRLAAARTATLWITDNQPVRDGQPDAVIQAGHAAPVGADVYFSPAPMEQTGSPEVAAVTNGIAGRASTFTISAVNHTTNAQTVKVQATNTGIGCTFKYLYGLTDVTADVNAGTFQFPADVPPNGAVSLTLQVTPSGRTPLRQMATCAVTVMNGTMTDQVIATVRRAR